MIRQITDKKSRSPEWAHSDTLDRNPPRCFLCCPHQPAGWQ